MKHARTAILIALFLSIVIPNAFGRCAGMPGPGIPPDPRPPPPPPPVVVRPPPLPTGAVGEGQRTPKDEAPEPEPGEETPPPTTTPGPAPEPEPAPASPEPKDAPSTPKPPEMGPGKVTGPASGPSLGGRPGGASPRPQAAVSYASAWRVWWELSREHLLGMRRTLEGAEPTTGAAGDILTARRLTARTALRKLSLTADDKKLRSVSLRALGRIGRDADADLFLQLLRSRNLPDQVMEGAAFGLASLDRVTDADVRADLRAFFDAVLEKKIWLPGRTRLLSILALSLRARDDPALVRSLGAKTRSDLGTANEAAALLFACGLTKDPMLASELTKALVTGEVGGRNLHDIARGHAALGLALGGEPSAIRSLTECLGSKDTKVHTRRSAAAAIGVFLRRDGLGEKDAENARRAVLRAFAEDRDPLVPGFCLLAMGCARTPFGLDLLVKTVDKSGDPVKRPFAALALGLATRHLGEKQVKRARAILVAELEKNRDPELAAALSVAVGLAGAKDAQGILIERIESPRLNPSVRGPACEALGLIGDPAPRVLAVLEKALDDDSDQVVEDAAIALGFIGRPATARLLVAKMATTKSRQVREHMVVALSHLGGAAAVGPLLEVVTDPTIDHAVRESAAEALGVLLDPRDVDPLFEIDAACNPYGLTDATRELVRIY